MSGHRLGYVPPPLPDETLYSVLAAHCRLAPDIDLTGRLLGPGRSRARIDWPVGLDLISTAFPPGLETAGRQLLAQHTLAPVHLPFIEQARQRALIKSMLQIDSGEPSKIAGARSTCVQNPRRVRVCARCFSDDVQAHGRAYIHRVHQFAGVVVCPDHPDCVLLDTDLFRSEAYLRKAYIDINDANIISPVASHLSPHESAVAAGVAKTVRRLLDSESDQRGPEHLRRALRSEIVEKGYVTLVRKVDLQGLQKAFGHWFTPKLSLALGVPRPLSHGHDSWLFRWLTRIRSSVHPLLPILITLFLEIDIFTLLESDLLAYPIPSIGNPPRPPGVSETYARFEASKSLLRRLWPRKELRVADLARRLGVSGLTVCRWAVAIDLPFPRLGPRIVFPPAERAHRPDIRQLIHSNRAQWQRILKRRAAGYPQNLVRHRLYGWLSRYDRAWLQRHMPRMRGAAQIDWPARDRLLVWQVERVATALRRQVPLVRVSRTRLANALGHPNWLLNAGFFARFPLTIAKLRQVEESRVAFAVRKLTTKGIGA